MGKLSSVKNIDGVLEVRLQDTTYNTFFRAKAAINNKKQILALLITLEEKGVAIPKGLL